MSNYSILNEQIESFNLAIPTITDLTDKQTLFLYHLNNMRKKCGAMFSYKGLPDTIPQRILEFYLQNNGYAIIFDKDDKLYCAYGGLGGKPDFNFMPTMATIAIPFLQLTTKRKIIYTYDYDNPQETDGKCVVIPNDRNFRGLLPTHSYYSSQLVENDLSMRCLKINTRLMNLLVAGDEDTLKSLQGVIEDLENGKISSAIDENWLFDGLKSVPFGDKGTASNIVQLLEERQYVKGSWWNELGVQSNYNMKRETITSSENILNVDSLLPISDDMIEMRRIYIDLVNKTYGTNITVDFSSSWKKIRNEIKIKEDLQLKELQQNESKDLDKKDNDKKEDKDNEKN